MVSTTDPGEAASLPAAKMAEALQRLAAAVVDAFSGEMGASGVEDLLKCTIQIYRLAGLLSCCRLHCDTRPWPCLCRLPPPPPPPPPRLGHAQVIDGRLWVFLWWSRPGIASMEGQDGVDGWGLFCNGARAGALLQVLYQCSTARCCSKLQILATLGFLFALWDQIMEGFSSSSDHAQRRGEGRGMKVACRFCSSLSLDVVDLPCFLSAYLPVLHVPVGPGC